MFGADGDPGDKSTKKLPSKKIRVLTLTVASRWIGRPFFLISIVTRAAPSPSDSASTFFTLPTSTPAIRTGEFGFKLFTLSNTACSSYGDANGFVFVKPKKVNRPI